MDYVERRKFSRCLIYVDPSTGMSAHRAYNRKTSDVDILPTPNPFILIFDFD